MRYIRPFFALVLVLRHVAVVAATPDCSEQMGTNIEEQDCRAALDSMWEVAHNPDKRPVHWSPLLPWEHYHESCVVHVDYVSPIGIHQRPEQIFTSEVRDAARYTIWHCVQNHRGRGGQIRIKGLQISISGRFWTGRPLYPPGTQADGYVPPQALQPASYPASQLPRSPPYVIEQHEADHLLPQAIKDFIGKSSHLQVPPPPPPLLPYPQMPVPPPPNTHRQYQPPMRQFQPPVMQYHPPWRQYHSPMRHGAANFVQSPQTTVHPPQFLRNLIPGWHPSDRSGLS